MLKTCCRISGYRVLRLFHERTGLKMFDISTLMWGMIFGLIGLGFFIYGKKQSSIVPLLCGMALMVFPYFVSNIYVLIGVGIVLIVLPFVIRE